MASYTIGLLILIQASTTYGPRELSRLQKRLIAKAQQTNFRISFKLQRNRLLRQFCVDQLGPSSFQLSWSSMRYKNDRSSCAEKFESRVCVKWVIRRRCGTSGVIFDAANNVRRRFAPPGASGGSLQKFFFRRARLLPKKPSHRSTLLILETRATR